MHQSFESTEPTQARPISGEPNVSWREQHFNPKEVSEILSIAVRLQSEGVKGEQILKMADEAGIAPEYVERAVLVFLQHKWQRVESDLAIRRRLRQIILIGGIAIGIIGLLGGLILLGGRAPASYAKTSRPQDLPYASIPPYTGISRESIGPRVYATSRSLSVSVRHILDENGGLVAMVALWRNGNSGIHYLQIPKCAITQISIAPNERRVALISGEEGGIWLVNADGSELRLITTPNNPLRLPNGEAARPTRQPLAGWNGDDLIVHTNQGRLRVRLSEDNIITKVERAQ
ncbi:MAG: hypothetical protein KatS3mg019_1653 [Fimbriimonadales bacterium]|nr:MAG: hypothetical protein KatS3mg019_1653 [Fimbriimonadales bacterium]